MKSHIVIFQAFPVCIYRFMLCSWASLPQFTVHRSSYCVCICLSHLMLHQYAFTTPSLLNSMCRHSSEGTLHWIDAFYKENTIQGSDTTVNQKDIAFSLSYLLSNLPPSLPPLYLHLGNLCSTIVSIGIHNCVLQKEFAEWKIPFTRRFSLPLSTTK